MASYLLALLGNEPMVLPSWIVADYDGTGFH
jgi:hypothetical protein